MRVSLSREFAQTGYDRMADIEDRVKKLTSVIAQALSNPRWESLADGTTFCNDCVCEIADELGVPDLRDDQGTPRIAESMGQKILRVIADAKDAGKPCKWRQDVAERAVSHAKKGGFGFGWSPELSAVGAKHNHVVVVAPLDMEDSSTFGYKVPMVASIARYPFENRVMKTSEAYRKKDAPIWLLYDADEDA